MIYTVTVGDKPVDIRDFIVYLFDLVEPSYQLVDLHLKLGIHIIKEFNLQLNAVWPHHSVTGEGVLKVLRICHLKVCDELRHRIPIQLDLDLRVATRHLEDNIVAHGLEDRIPKILHSDQVVWCGSVIHFAVRISGDYTYIVLTPQYTVGSRCISVYAPIEVKVVVVLLDTAIPLDRMLRVYLGHRRRRILFRTAFLVDILQLPSVAIFWRSAAIHETV